MAFFERALRAKVMSTSLLVQANVTKKVLLEAYTLATDFEARYSAYRHDSYLNEINQNAGIKPVACTAQDYHLFQTSIEASKQTNGLFDITIGALSHGAYHFGFTNQCIADKDLIDRQKRLVDYREIQLNPSSIYLQKRGMRLDIGGIGKGYIAMRIAMFLASKGATRLLVDVGGEIVTRGKSYTIAIQDPSGQHYRAIIKTSKEDIAISTSGNYERYTGSTANHHILDTSRGTPSPYYSSMTLLQHGWNSDMLDAYATALFNQAPRQLSTYANQYNIAILAIGSDNEMITHNIDLLRLKSLQFF